jgi:hypothetical protein
VTSDPPAAQAPISNIIASLEHRFDVGITASLWFVELILDSPESYQALP